MTEQPKPVSCPFCGSDAHTKIASNMWVKVQCSNSVCAASILVYKDESKAIKLWNARSDETVQQLQRENAELEEKYDALEVVYAHLDQEKQDLKNELAAANARAEAAEKDAERLDFIQAGIEWHVDIADDESNDFVLFRATGSVNDREFKQVGRGKTLRLAIDAARSGQQEKCNE